MFRFHFRLLLLWFSMATYSSKKNLKLKTRQIKNGNNHVQKFQFVYKRQTKNYDEYHARKKRSRHSQRWTWYFPEWIDRLSCMLVISTFFCSLSLSFTHIRNSQLAGVLRAKVCARFIQIRIHIESRRGSWMRFGRKNKWIRRNKRKNNTKIAGNWLWFYVFSKEKCGIVRCKGYIVFIEAIDNRKPLQAFDIDWKYAWVHVNWIFAPCVFAISAASLMQRYCKWNEYNKKRKKKTKEKLEKKRTELRRSQIDLNWSQAILAGPIHFRSAHTNWIFTHVETAVRFRFSTRCLITKSKHVHISIDENSVFGPTYLGNYRVHSV